MVTAVIGLLPFGILAVNHLAAFDIRRLFFLARIPHAVFGGHESRLI